MADEKLVEQVKELAHALHGIERELASGNVPAHVLDEFKRAVDHARMTLWAVITTAQAEQQEVVAAATVRYRLGRTVQLCRQTIEDIRSGRITTATPELPIYQATLEETLEHVRRLPDR